MSISSGYNCVSCREKARWPELNPRICHRTPSSWWCFWSVCFFSSWYQVRCSRIQNTIHARGYKASLILSFSLICNRKRTFNGAQLKVSHYTCKKAWYEWVDLRDRLPHSSHSWTYNAQGTSSTKVRIWVDSVDVTPCHWNAVIQSFRKKNLLTGKDFVIFLKMGPMKEKSEEKIVFRCSKPPP